ATIRAEERRCSRELWPQFGECQDNKLFRLRRRSRSRQGKQVSRRDSRPRLSSRSEASVSKTQPALSKILREIAVTSLRGARRIDSASNRFLNPEITSVLPAISPPGWNPAVEATFMIFAERRSSIGLIKSLVSAVSAITLS